MFLVICLRTRTCMHFTLFFTSALFATAFLETSNSNLPAHWLEGKNKEKKREKKNQNETNNKTTVDVKRAGVHIKKVIQTPAFTTTTTITTAFTTCPSTLVVKKLSLKKLSILHAMRGRRILLRCTEVTSHLARTRTAASKN